MSKLMKQFEALVDNYRITFINAPVRWGQKVFGRNVPTKKDVRSAFLQDLKMLAELAELMQDQAVLDKINGVVNKQDKEIAALEQEIATITAPK